MNIDIQKLKALAEAATPGPWTVSEEHESASFQGYVAGDADGWIAIFGTTNQDADNADYVAAANPAAVLELIAEIERLRDSHEQICANYNKVSFASEERGKQIDQLKTDNTDLHATLQSAKGEIERLKGESEALRNLASELRGSAECNNVHHRPAEQHELSEPCKVLARIDAAMNKDSTHD